MNQANYYRKYPRLLQFFAILLLTVGCLSSAFAATPQAMVIPCPGQPLPSSETGLLRAKGDAGAWNFSLTPAQGVTISNQVWTYPGKGGDAPDWGVWVGGDGTNSLSWSAPNKAGAFSIKVKAKRRCVGGPGPNGVVVDEDFELSWSGNVISIEIIDSAGNTITTKRTTIVGARQLLKGKIIGALDNAVITNKKWVIGGTKVKNYDQTSVAIAAKEDLQAADLQNQDEVAFYWIDGGAEIEVEFSATVNGTSATAKAMFDVNRPKANYYKGIQTTLIRPVDVRRNGLKFGLYFGAYDSSPGIKWEAEVATPANGQGEIAIVQLVNVLHERTSDDAANTKERLSSDGKLVLDNAVVSPIYFDEVTKLGNNDTQTYSNSDSPGNPLGPGRKFVTATDSFETYLMYKPTGDDSIWVTLSVLTWSWSGSATRVETDDPNSNDWVRTSGKPDRESEAAPKLPDIQGVNSTTLPEWNGFAYNLKFKPV